MTENVEYVAQWTANTNTAYTVKYYYQQADGTYSGTPDATAGRTGTTATTASLISTDLQPVAGLGVSGQTYVEDTTKRVDNQTIAGDGSTVLKVYFKLQFTVTYAPGTQGTWDKSGAGYTTSGLDYNANTPAEPTNRPHNPGYTFNGWTPVLAEKVTENVEYVAQWTANINTAYTVNHYLQKADGTYPNTANYSDSHTGTTDATVSIDAVKRIVDGYTFDAAATKYSDSENITPTSDVLTIAGDGSLVIDLYYTINSYDVTVTKAFSGVNALPETFQITNDYTSDVFTVETATGSGAASDPYKWTVKIPYDVTVSFTESGYDVDGYSVDHLVKVSVNQGAFTTSSATAKDNIAVRIPANDATTVAFTNTYAKVFNPEGKSDEYVIDSFQIKKTGDNTGDTILGGATFQLLDGNTVVWEDTTKAGELLTVVIEEGDIRNPDSVSTSRTYTLRESSAPGGYTATGDWTVSLTGSVEDKYDAASKCFYHIYTWSVESVETADGKELYSEETKNVPIVNTRDRGELTIEKKLAGDSNTEASGKTFTFDITGPTDVNGTFDGVKFEGGKATVSIKGAGSQKITGLPTGSYTVKENTSDIQISYMDLTVSYLDSDKDPSDTEKANTADGIVTVLKGEESTMTVTNTYIFEDDGDDDDDEPEIIKDPEVPTTDVPVIPVDPAEPEEPPVEIDEEEPPLAEAPETGDATIAWILAAAVSGIGLVWLAISGKKRKDESAE